jgi:hypothetical protein
MRAAVLAACTVALAAGCGGGGDSSAQATVVAAADKTADEGSARVSMKGAVEGNADDQSTLTASGAFDGDRGRTIMTVDDGGRREETQLAFDGTVYYIKLPPAGQAGLPEGKDWIKMDVAEFSPGGENEDLSSFMQFSQSDPTQTLGFLKGASDDFEVVGTEDVRGVETTHYSGTIDLQTVADESDELGDVYEQLLDKSEFKEIPAEVWIDADGLCRRINYELPVPEQRGGGTATLTVEFYDFGEDVEVEPPTEAESYDLGEAANPTTTGVSRR